MPVFSRPLNVERVKSKGLCEKISANEKERRQLARQLELNDLLSLSMNCILIPWKKGGLELKGTVEATIEEICVVTLEPFTTEISEEVRLLFEQQGGKNTAAPLIDLETLEDEVPERLENGIIDLGEIAVEALALVLSPYPRKPGVVFEDHVESDPDEDGKSGIENPFDVLKQLKKH